MKIARAFLAGERKTAARAGRWNAGSLRRIHTLDILRLQPFVALNNLEGDGVAFVQGFESRPDDGRVMHEDILTGILGDEPEPFSIVKPLDFAASHK
jgi:hypothetical protein